MWVQIPHLTKLFYLDFIQVQIQIHEMKCDLKFLFLTKVSSCMPYSTAGRHAVAISHDIWLSTVQNMNVIEEYSLLLGAKLINNKMSGKIYLSLEILLD